MSLHTSKLNTQKLYVSAAFYSSFNFLNTVQILKDTVMKRGWQGRQGTKQSNPPYMPSSEPICQAKFPIEIQASFLHIFFRYKSSTQFGAVISIFNVWWDKASSLHNQKLWTLRCSPRFVVTRNYSCRLLFRQQDSCTIKLAICILTF